MRYMYDVQIIIMQILIPSFGYYYVIISSDIVDNNWRSDLIRMKKCVSLK